MRRTFLTLTALSVIIWYPFSAHGAFGPPITLSVETPAIAGMPIWLDAIVDDGCLEAHYSANGNPAYFGFGNVVDVQRDGHAIQSRLAAWGTWDGSGPASLGPCPGSHASNPASSHRFPLHLPFLIDQPGHYRVRWSVWRLSPGVIAQSDWLSFDVKAAVPGQRDAWITHMLAARPTDPRRLTNDYIPSLLAAADDRRVIKALFDLACTDDAHVANIALHAIPLSFGPHYHTETMAAAQAGCPNLIPLAFRHARGAEIPAARHILTESALAALTPRNSITQWTMALNALTILLQPPPDTILDPALLAQAQAHLLPLAPVIMAAHDGGLSRAFLQFLWCQPMPAQTKAVIWAFATTPNDARDEALTLIAQLADPADLPRFTTIFAGAPDAAHSGDGHEPRDLYGTLDEVARAFGSNAVPLLQKTMTEATDWGLRDIAALHLAARRDKRAIQLIIAGLEKRDSSESGFIMSDLSDLEDKDHRAINRCGDTSDCAIAYFKGILADDSEN